MSNNLIADIFTRSFRTNSPTVVDYREIDQLGINQKVLTNDECGEEIIKLMKKAAATTTIEPGKRILHISCAEYVDKDKKCTIHCLPQGLIYDMTKQTKSNNACLYASGVATGMFLFSMFVKK